MLGWVGDTYGNLRLLRVTCWSALGTGAAALAAGWHPAFLYLAVLGTGAAMSGAFIAFPNLTLELSPPGEEGRYAALSSQILAVAGSVGPLLGGLLVKLFGYPAMFAVTFVLGMLTVGMVHRLTLVARREGGDAV